MTLTFNPKTGKWEGTTGGVDLKKLAQPKIVVRIEKSPEDIEAKIMANPIYAYAINLANYIAQQVKLKMGEPIFRNRQASCYNSKTKQIWFSYENITNTFKKYFTEYVSVYQVWTKFGYRGEYRQGYRVSWYQMKVTGYEAVWMLVLHEMAHALQHTRNNGNFSYAHHDDIFRNALEELIILFPYNKVKEL